MLTAQEEISELPYLAMYSILKAAKATGDTCMAQQVYEDAALHYTRALEWGIKSGHLTDSKVAALRLARSNAHLLSGELVVLGRARDLNRTSLSLLSGSAGRAEEARKDAEEAIRLRPLCPKVREPRERPSVSRVAGQRESFRNLGE